MLANLRIGLRCVVAGTQWAIVAAVIGMNQRLDGLRGLLRRRRAGLHF